MRQHSIVIFHPPGFPPATLFVEVAANDVEQVAGLANRPGVPDGTGMLFVFQRDVELPFTVYEMRVPIDLVFADARGRVLRAYHALPPRSMPLVRAPGPYRYAVETSAGFCVAHGIGEGTRMDSPTLWTAPLAQA